jgi:thiol-disulfide isomerase/thioredoxin
MLASALMLGACGGQAAAAVDANTQSEADASADVQVESEADAEADTGQDSSAGADAAAEVDAQAEVELEAYPELVLGRSEMRATNPAEVTIASGQLQFIEFFAFWCPNCKAMAPHVHGLEQIYGDRMNFVYLDRDDPATVDLQAQLGYIYQPHIFILDEAGNILFQSVYFTEASVLQEAIEMALANH